MKNLTAWKETVTLTGVGLILVAMNIAAVAG